MNQEEREAICSSCKYGELQGARCSIGKMLVCGNLGNKRHWKPRKKKLIKIFLKNIFGSLRNLDNQLWSATFKEPDKVELLLGKGADANSKTKHGYTPLMQAAQWDNIVPIKALLKFGANVNAKDFGEDDSSGTTPIYYAGETALMRAVIKGNINVTKELLKHGADPKIKNKYGETALMLANDSMSNNKHKIIKILRSHNDKKYNRLKT